MTMTERIGGLDLLHRLCKRKGWALLIRADGEKDASRLTTLEVAEPGVGDTRKRQLIAGDLVARVQIESATELELAAATIIQALVSRGHFDFGKGEAA